ncbi:glucosylceramidase [Deminuibacter soli]|uniref:Glucosylceramidase n=2 Tax=Deminuibacter soli TaxID=2291815 RepID=A0A3E1NEJ0_9BACT|nr:glucosylceramidase [Deminuibacter soli]
MQAAAAVLLLAGTAACTSVKKNSSAQQTQTGVTAWVTDADNSLFFEPQTINGSKAAANMPVITIDEQQTFQQMDGFGCTLTGGSAQLIQRMTPAARTALLKELFDTTGRNIGMSYLRVSIGASDLNDRIFSYDDMPAGETDFDLEHFSLAPDEADVIPVLQQILAINPRIKILGSPWSAPVWMKNNGDTRGGSLLPRYQPAYAQYFVKYIKGMQQHGINIDAITIQNEPLHPGNNPSMLMLPAQQADFIKNNLGPLFASEHISTKIILYDHNADRPDYPLSILNDPGARKYVDGSAFHLYGGHIDTLASVHAAYPDKNLYFTEQWVGAPGNLKKDLDEHVRKLSIGAARNWCRTVLEWNLAADPKQNPHTDRGGCNGCLGAVTIAGDTVSRNPAYYIIAQSAKLVRPGSVRIASNEPEGLKNVAYRTPQGKKVLLVLNTGSTAKQFYIKDSHQQVAVSLSPGAVATYTW